MTLALLGAVLIGVSLGLLGSGGSILTVPVLVYLVGQSEKVAIAGSLGIVGTIALAAAIPNARAGRVSWRHVVWFGLPGMAGTYLGAYLSQFVSGRVQLGLFAVVMLSAAGLMLRSPARGSDREPRPARQPRLHWIALEGLLVGVLTGLVGVGGGFLIVPALVLLGGLPVHVAVGTSLVVIALKSASGFVKYLNVLGEQGLRLDWGVLAMVSAVGIAGTFLGGHVGRRVSERTLRRTFAVFLLAMGALILARVALR